MTEVHVIVDERSTWRVVDGDAAVALSEHTNATEAERAARACAEERDAERVVIHDRYHRTHDVTLSGVLAREQRARERQLALVRGHADRLARAPR